MSSQVAKKNEQQIDRHTGQAQRMKQVDEREVEAKASANVSSLWRSFVHINTLAAIARTTET
jgi:hypothetical protein